MTTERGTAPTPPTAAESSSPTPPTVAKVPPDRPWKARSNSVLAIDIGGSKIMAGVVGADGTVRSAVTLPLGDMLTRTPSCQDRRRELFLAVLQVARAALDHTPADAPGCVGVSVPGLADPDRGVWEYSSFSGIADFHVAEALTHELGLPVHIENDVKACALGEQRFGCCAGVRDYLWVTVSNGVGGCAVVDGTILRGARNHAGEIGHLTVVDDGYPCQCGSRGCTEAYAAGPAIARRYHEIAGPQAPSLDAEAIAARAGRGDVAARKVFADTGVYLGKAIAAAVNMLNPELVVLGGGVAQSLDLFGPELRRTFDAQVFRQANPQVTIRATALGYQASLIGAAAVGLRGQG